jgi:lipopolysaccharide transport system ATP-binding protein
MDDIVAFAGLAGVIDDPISSWSDGMRARLGFSVAYHADPQLLLLDESLGTGDAEFHAKSAAAMRERIRSDRTCVLVSHDAATIAELCDRCLWIEDGLVAAEGRPAEVLAAYDRAWHEAARAGLPG